MASLNLSTNGPSITNSYNKVVNSPAPTGPVASSPTYGQWALFTVQAPLVSAFQQESGKESVLKVQTTGEGELIDLVEDFSDGRIQFAFVKVKDPNTTLPKSVLIAWCGAGVPERTKGYFTNHLNAVSRLLHGYHVQITARTDADLTPESIVQKVADSSGSKYSGGGTVPAADSRPPPAIASKPAMPTKSFGAAGGFQPLGARSRAPPQSGRTDEDGWGEDAPPVTRSQLEKVGTAYQPTKVDIAQLQSQHEPSRYQTPAPSNGNPDVVKGGYQPIGKVDINAIRREAQDRGPFQDDRPTVIKGAYEPVGKVDIADIKRKAQGAPAPAPVPPIQPADEDQPRSLAERSAAFSGGDGRLTSLPKPALSNRFGSQASNFAGTKAPAPGGFEARPNVPSAAPVGMASKNFADEGGKTPAQIWAERKARERGNSGAADPNPTGGIGGGSPAPIASQTSGGWQSGYAGKKWDVSIPSRTGGSGVADEPAYEEPEIPAAGGVGAIRDRFKDAPPMGATHESSFDAPSPPPLDTASKPNAGAARGVPIPGLPQRPPASEVPAEDHQALPPPPPRPIPQDEEEEEDEGDYGAGAYRPSSPVRIAMPVARNAEPDELEKPDSLPPRPVAADSLARVATQHEADPAEPEPEPMAQDADLARSAAQTAAASATADGVTVDPRGAGDGGGKSAIAQYDYEKAEDNELELRDGERITDIEMVDEDWWMGRNERGETGLFPANYVELLPDGAGAGADAALAARPVPAPAPVAEEPAAPVAVGAPAAGTTATAQYDYEAAEDNELSFPDGATITDVEFPDDDWWFGHYGGKSGLFPANYVQLDA